MIAVVGGVAVEKHGRAERPCARLVVVGPLLLAGFAVEGDEAGARCPLATGDHDILADGQPVDVSNRRFWLEAPALVGLLGDACVGVGGCIL
ncbi:hypothetical protein BBD46_04920 [Natrialba sp. SSL1]|nr:hypothetical protein BBD46_04920 [Natrialba sp. SSL1]